MKHFQPKVKVVRQNGGYHMGISGMGEMTGVNAHHIFRFVVEGTAQVVVEDLDGFDFRSPDLKESFIYDVHQYIASLNNYPDNFDEKDRQDIARFVENLLLRYYQERKIILSNQG